MTSDPSATDASPAAQNAGTHASAAAIAERELAIEQAHVDRVYEQLNFATEQAVRIRQESQEKFTSDRADWVREEDGTAMFERDAFAYQAAKRLAILDAEHEGLVFGRLDLHGDDTRYIGRLGVRDDDYEPLVIDWRAPAAEPFYRATATQPMDVVRRRVLRCRDDRVISIEDDLLDESAGDDVVIIGEGALMASLQRARGSHMRDIVATIQSEQDEAIRAPYQGVTVISGGPGTGKTVVALHRAAYLLYTNRKRLEQGGVLVVGPTDIFMRYIESVLPGLGESSVTLRSIGGLARDVLGISSRRVGSGAAATLKGSLRMLPVLRRAVNEPFHETAATTQLRVTVKGEVLTLNQQELMRIRRDVLSNHRLNESRPAVEKALTDALWAKLPTDVAAILDLERADFDDLVTGQSAYETFVPAWWPAVTAEQVLARLAEPEHLHKCAHAALSSDEEATLIESLAHARGWLPETGQPHPDWSIADMALLDEIAAMVGPVPHNESTDPTLFLDSLADVAQIVTTADRLTTTREIDEDEPISTYSHVLVDESQDITPMQWRMLRRRGPQASWTLVGDPAQSSYPHLNETQLAVRELIGRAPHRTFTLSTNYRSPKEIMDLAGKVIRVAVPDAAVPTSVRETGVEPSLLATTPERLAETLRQTFSALAEEVEGSISLVTTEEAFEHASELVAGLDLPEDVASRIVILTALQVKGLEFDATVVLSPDDIVEKTPGGVRVLYVALTRPTQRLVTIDLSGPQPGAWRESLG